MYLLLPLSSKGGGRMRGSLPILYQLAKESAHYVHAAAARPAEVHDLLGVRSRTVKQIWAKRGRMTADERELARFASDGVAGVARGPVTAAATAALRELVSEALGATSLASDWGRRAKALAAELWESLREAEAARPSVSDAGYDSHGRRVTGTSVSPAPLYAATLPSTPPPGRPMDLK